jgi:hypothetical protein
MLANLPNQNKTYKYQKSELIINNLKFLFSFYFFPVSDGGSDGLVDREGGNVKSEERKKRGTEETSAMKINRTNKIYRSHLIY